MVAGMLGVGMNFHEDGWNQILENNKNKYFKDALSSLAPLGFIGCRTVISIAHKLFCLFNPRLT